MRKLHTLMRTNSPKRSPTDRSERYWFQNKNLQYIYNNSSTFELAYYWYISWTGKTTNQTYSCPRETSLGIMCVQLRPCPPPFKTPQTSHHYRTEGFKGGSELVTVMRDLPGRMTHTQRKLFEILLNQTEIRLYSPFFYGFVSEQTLYIWVQINQCMVNTIWFQANIL